MTALVNAARFVEQDIAALLDAHPVLAEDADLRADMIEGSTNLDAVLGRLGGAILDAKAMAAAVKQQRDDLAERGERFAKREQALRAIALRLMELADLTKRELAVATFSVRATPPAVQIVDEDALPDIACRIKREPDKKRIKELLADGPVAGARLSNGGVTLAVLPT